MQARLQPGPYDLLFTGIEKLAIKLTTETYTIDLVIEIKSLISSVIDRIIIYKHNILELKG